VALHERSRRYEAAGDGIHRHRVVCRDCGRIESFPAMACDLSGLEADIRRRCGFKVTEHSLEFFGSCPDCRRKTGVK
jgi:Fe2+ or Zn2+ uptake regulation protein